MRERLLGLARVSSTVLFLFRLVMSVPGRAVVVGVSVQSLGSIGQLAALYHSPIRVRSSSSATLVR